MEEQKIKKKQEAEILRQQNEERVKQAKEKSEIELARMKEV